MRVKPGGIRLDVWRSMPREGQEQLLGNIERARSMIDENVWRRLSFVDRLKLSGMRNSDAFILRRKLARAHSVGGPSYEVFVRFNPNGTPIAPFATRNAIVKGMRDTLNLRADAFRPRNVAEGNSSKAVPAAGKSMPQHPRKGKRTKKKKKLTG